MLAYRQDDHGADETTWVVDPTPQAEAEGLRGLPSNGSSCVQAVAEGRPATSLIAIVDRRALGREVLTTALRTTQGGLSSRGYAGIGDWLADENRHETSAVLIGIGGTSSDDPELATDLRSLTGEHPQIPMIVMGDSEDPSHVLEILSYGARGYIPTSVSLSVAIGALSLAIAGGVFVPASALLDTGPAPRQSPEAGTVFGLTERQAAVAEAIARGTPNKIIAYELNLSESTVKVHTRSIMRKLQARNRTEVAFKLHATKARPRSASGLV
ncbi:DNA-binding NarL/FixJ family response regulator [Inquilinus ginsengisoli]